MVSNPLQSKVSAYGQGQICDSGDDMRERFHGGIKDESSVGSILFVVRNGKSATHELDNLAERQADTEVGSI
jgi:hypothetical protein